MAFFNLRRGGMKHPCRRSKHIVNYIFGGLYGFWSCGAISFVVGGNSYCCIDGKV